MIAPMLFALSVTASHTYAIAVGNNALPVNVRDSSLTPLQFSDDDAAAMSQLFTSFGVEIELLASFDRDTERRFRDLAPRPPTLEALVASVARVAERLVQDRRDGVQSAVFFFFSGHGGVDADGRYFLALQDAALTTERLYEDVLARLPADTVHVFVDACHAEGVVRPRDISPEAVILDAARRADISQQLTLARFGHVGAIVASSTDRQSHEWDEYQGGIFTHQLLSGLRGGADVNRDLRVEYSELDAFFAAANDAIADPRGHLAVVSTPPRLLSHVPILDLRSAGQRVAWLKIDAPVSGVVSIEDVTGLRIADVHPELGFEVRMALPAERDLFLRHGAEEARITLKPTELLRLSRVAWRGAAVRARGALLSALRAGLFATAFGPAYYQRFVVAQNDVAVDLRAEQAARDPGYERPPSRAGPYALFASAGALAAASVALGVIALDTRAAFERTSTQREAHALAARYDALRYSSFVGAGLTAAAVGVAVAWLLWRPNDAITLDASGGRDGLYAGIRGRF